MVSADRGDTAINCQILFGFFHGLVEVWFCGSSTISATVTSTATTTTTATAERLFEALRVYCLVILSMDRGLVVLRCCKGNEELRGAAVY